MATVRDITRQSSDFQKFFEHLNVPDIQTVTNDLMFVNNEAIDKALANAGISWKQISRETLALNSLRRKTWDFSVFTKAPENTQAPIVIQQQTSGDLRMKAVHQLVPYIPPVDPKYVPWGDNYEVVMSIMASGSFFPTLVSGPSGNGKTEMIEQLCAKLGRSYVRVQINPETDEDDLMGGLRLIENETVFAEGPVACAMRTGSLLLIDELDRGTNKIMCMQGVMEGKPVLIKKTGETITPAKGFNIIATANTLGRGSDDGKYSAANIIDDAFLERFAITLVQDFAPAKVEEQILKNHAKAWGIEQFKHLDQIIPVMVKWAAGTRSTRAAGGMDDEISTRRLCHAVKMMKFVAHMKGDTDRLAVQFALQRFTKETAASFMDTYNATRPAQFVDPSVNPEETPNPAAMSSSERGKELLARIEAMKKK